MNDRNSKPSVAERILRSLQEFTDALKSDADLTKRFRVHVVHPNRGPELYSSGIVRQTRKLIRANPTTFAQLLGVPVATVRSWEKGTSIPSGIACRFMEEIQHNPTYWRGRLEATTAC